MANLSTALEALSLHDSHCHSRRQRHGSINHAKDFHKVRIVSRHDLVCGSVQQTVLTNLTNSPAEVAQRSFPPLSQLTPITLLHMELGVAYPGRFLHGTLCVDAFHTSSTITCLQVQPGMAVRLYLPLFTTSLSHVQSLFPNGARFAIKEPYLKRCLDGVVTIEVDNPSAVERLEQNIHDGDQRDHNELFEEGNRQFEEKNWEGAIDSYSQCIQLIIYKGSLATSTLEALPEDKQSELLAYSIRAEAWIRLENFEQALRDSIRAMEIDPNHVQSLIRRGCALHGLQQFKQASSSFQKALEKDPQNREIEDALQDSRRCYNSVTGNFDHVTDFLISGISNIDAVAPKCCQYTGPVVMKMTTDGRGRGLFACRDVKAGELLLVSTPLVLCPQAPIAGNNHAAQAKAFTNASQELITAVFCFAKSSEMAQNKIGYLQVDSNIRNSIVPPMEMFEDGIRSPDDTSAVDVDLSSVSGIVRLNSFTGRSMVEATRNPWFTGIWLLPSFINHSCMRNSTYMYIGHAMFIHSAADIEEGEEIKISYVDSLLPVLMREEKLKATGFSCNCKRCEVERSLSNTLGSIFSDYTLLHEKAVGEANSALKAGKVYPSTVPECARLARLTLKLEKEMERATEAEKNWIRASYATAYIAGIMASDFVSALPVEEIVEAMVFASPGHPRTLSLIQWQISYGIFPEDQALDACIRTYGKWNPDVLTALIYSESGPRNLFRKALQSFKLD